MHAPPRTSAQTTPKLLGLEIVRFLSALAVLVWHYQHFFYVADAPLSFDRPSQPFFTTLRLFYEFGNYGVQLFWCISGFIFFWKYREIIASRAIGPMKFFALRFSRLYPLHLATLLATGALQSLYLSTHQRPFVYQFNDLRHFILQLGLAGSWGLERGYSFNGPSWSVSVEVLVYFVFFVTLRHVSRSSLVNLAMVSACLLLQQYRDYPLVESLAFFYAGGLSAIAYRHYQAKGRQRRALTATVLAVFVLPAATSMAGVLKSEAMLRHFLVLYVPLLLFLCATEFTLPPRLQKGIEVAGNMTYSSYLIHFPLQLLIVYGFGVLDRSVPVHSSIFFLAFFSATFSLSYVVYRYFEVPAQRLVRRIIA
ncbi:acyltransferase [Gemmatimonas sp.]|uniref:acyltransferase family protein n=1 Tax=Gemmatimonas sp. TaxID=1962908 RepID=UPI00286E6B0D|nr:acyltransferase [Gemmatimonas sp.]